MGVSKPNREIEHDKVFSNYVIGKSYYYAGDMDKAVQYFLEALKMYNESSLTVKYFERRQLKSNYKEKLQKLI